MWMRIFLAMLVSLSMALHAVADMESSGLAPVALADAPALETSVEPVLKRPPLRNLDEVLASGYLNVGLYRDFPPYSYSGPDGEALGVDADIGRAIAEGLNLEFRPFWIKPGESLGADLRNTISLGHYLRRTQVADVMMRVPYDRQFSYMRDSTGEIINKMVVMFGPYQQEQWQIAFDAAQMDDVPTLAVFQRHVIGAEYSTLPATYLTAFLNGQIRHNVRHYRDMAHAFDAMAKGEVAAVMGIRGELEHFIEQHDGRDFQLASNAFPGITRQHWDVGMAVRHNHRQLGYAVEAVVDSAVREGQLTDIFARHGLDYRMPAFYADILLDEDEG